jgi:hypothetical protein
LRLIRTTLVKYGLTYCGASGIRQVRVLMFFRPTESNTAGVDIARYVPTPRRRKPWHAQKVSSNAGLELSVVTLWLGAFTTEGYRLASCAHSPTADSVGYLFGYLSWAPLLFVVIAALWNALGRRKLPPIQRKRW